MTIFELKYTKQERLRTYMSKGFTICCHIDYFLPTALQQKVGPWPPLLGFLNHAQLDPWLDSSGRVISQSQRPLTTQDNTIYTHKRQTSMLSAGFEPEIPATKRPQTYSLVRTATGIGHFDYLERLNLSWWLWKIMFEERMRIDTPVPVAARSWA
jgi:hypothetical protein